MDIFSQHGVSYLTVRERLMFTSVSKQQGRNILPVTVTKTKQRFWLQQRRREMWERINSGFHHKERTELRFELNRSIEAFGKRLIENPRKFTVEQFVKGVNRSHRTVSPHRILKIRLFLIQSIDLKPCTPSFGADPSTCSQYRWDEKHKVKKLKTMCWMP